MNSIPNIRFGLHVLADGGYPPMLNISIHRRSKTVTKMTQVTQGTVQGIGCKHHWFFCVDHIAFQFNSWHFSDMTLSAKCKLSVLFRIEDFFHQP